MAATEGGLSAPDHDPLTILENVTMFVFKPEIELVEAITIIDLKNKFRIFDEMGRLLLLAVEESTANGPNRNFTMHVTDYNSEEILTLERPFSFSNPCYISCSCFDVCRQQIETFSLGQKVGSVRVQWTLFRSKFIVYTVEEEPRYDIIAQRRACSKKEVFTVYLHNTKQTIGEIRKKYLAHETITDDDAFGLTVDANIPHRDKALLISAVFLIHVLFFSDE
ncbi:phospholipid scramblase 2-like [Physella acuta]|uniref:phospholipid scramblase 2-like n=1 Tax=Physella acuta TaxID=109671 RepID=UPI0027DE01A2|nr:phospholipid scramblase 2-like [Physella acuta]